MSYMISNIQWWLVGDHPREYQLKGAFGLASCLEVKTIDLYRHQTIGWLCQKKLSKNRKCVLFLLVFNIWKDHIGLLFVTWGSMIWHHLTKKNWRFRVCKASTFRWFFRALRQVMLLSLLHQKSGTVCTTKLKASCSKSVYPWGRLLSCRGTWFSLEQATCHWCGTQEGDLDTGRGLSWWKLRFYVFIGHKVCHDYKRSRRFSVLPTGTAWNSWEVLSILCDEIIVYTKKHGESIFLLSLSNGAKEIASTIFHSLQPRCLGLFSMMFLDLGA